MLRTFDGLSLTLDHTKDRDGALSHDELTSLFSTSPGNPWVSKGFPETTITSDSGAVTLQGWLAQWRSVFPSFLPPPPLFLWFSLSVISFVSPSMTTLLEPRITLEYLAYLGYPHSSTTSAQLLPTTSALDITRPRKQDRKKGTVSRNVFLAYVLGAAGSGKTAILRAFVGKKLVERFEPTMKVKTVVNSVESGGGEKYLVVSFRFLLLFGAGGWVS